jgi:hypothetical protein
MKKTWLVLPVLAIIGVGAGLYSWWQSPASTSQVDQGSQSVNAVLGSTTRLEPWQTSYFTTRYPATLRIRSTTEDSSRAIIGSYLLTSIDTAQQDQVGVTVGTLGNNTFDGISAIKYRSMHPELYTQSSRSYAPAGAVAFDATNEYETDIIWQSGEHYAVVAVTGSSSRRAELEQVAQAVVSNWQWQ